MILRTGIDMIEIERVQSALQRHGERFLRRVFTENERQVTGERIDSLAVRYAAKEAVAKAFCTGIGDISFQEIEILKGQRGEPKLLLHGRAAQLADELGLVHWSISLSHTQTLAVAYVTALGE